jgi:hypothetical protein
MKQLPIAVLAMLLISSASAQRVTLVKRHKPVSSIVVPPNASVSELKAAAVLQNYVRQISGAVLDIHYDTISSGGTEVLIGNVKTNEREDAATTALSADGFIIRTNGNKLLIQGGVGNGALYGVYTLLEKYLGCRQYSSRVGFVPRSRSIVLPAINDTQVPSFAFRRIEYRDANVGEFADWNRVTDGHEWGTWCHTFSELLPPAEYGQSNPEYFSFYDGARHPQLNAHGEPESQLCLSNPQVLQIVTDNLKKFIDQNPTARYWSVSQNDNVRYCQCAECTKLNQEYASADANEMYVTGTMKYAANGMGSLMYFLNKLAASFPDRVISTLAYQYSRKPPVNITPASNINIMLCDIESPRGVPITEGDQPFAKDLAGWGRLSKDILVWDYVIQFRHLLAPFPNLRTLQPNIQFLRSNGVTALFEQGNRQSGGEFAELRAYLLTRLMWNEKVNVDSVMNQFLDGYYGKGGREIRKYIDLMHDKLEQSDSSLTIFGTPVQARTTFLTDSLINVYNGIFDRAEKLTQASPEDLMRVQTARLPLYYAMLEIARSKVSGPGAAFIDDDKGSKKPNPIIVDLLNKFVSQCLRTGVTRIAEWHTTPQDYLEAYYAFLSGRPAPPVKRLH